MMSKILMLFFLVVSGEALIGYDCGSKYMNVTTLSLIDVGECDIPEEDISVSKEYIQLLQLNEYTETPVIQCKIEVHRTVYYCGMHSHVSVVENGEIEYISEMSKGACELAHNFGTIKYSRRHMIQGLRVNQTSTHSVTFAGSLTTNGGCKGETFTDLYGTWNDAVVQGTLKITLTSYTAKINLDTNQIHLQNGLVCRLSESNCLDMENGNTFWRPIPEDKCGFNRYSVLYEGLASKIVDNSINGLQTVYSLTTEDVTFALAIKGKQNVCGYSITQTEHPKLFIFETKKGQTFAIDKNTALSDLDIFSYVNSKFVYVEKYVRTQIKQLYKDIVAQRCNLERAMLKNTLSLATQAPDEFAYNLMKGPGYMAVLAGEVVHVIKCIPVEVKLEHGEACYAELQVSRNNETFFMTARTHILKTKGTLVNCNALIPAYYKVGESWYKILPRPTESLSPITIKPQSKPTWKYISPSNLATSGIYTERDLNKLRERIMFPMERQALLNDVAREMTGQVIVDEEGTISKLMNSDVIDTIADHTWNHVWNKFLTFGTISAGIIAIITIFQGLKLLTNIVIRGYTLHSVFGWSFHLLGAVCSSISHLLIVKRDRTNSGRYSFQDVEANPTPTNEDDFATKSTRGTNVESKKGFFTLKA